MKEYGHSVRRSSDTTHDGIGESLTQLAAGGFIISLNEGGLDDRHGFMEKG
jgi:hypothetical protein